MKSVKNILMVSNGVKGVGGLSIRVQFIISFAMRVPASTLMQHSLHAGNQTCFVMALPKIALA